MINTQTLEQDIPAGYAEGAFRNISFSPERRGKSVTSDYVRILQSLAAFIGENAKDERQQAIAQEVFDRIRNKYKARTMAWQRQLTPNARYSLKHYVLCNELFAKYLA